MKKFIDKCAKYSKYLTLFLILMAQGGCIVFGSSKTEDGKGSGIIFMVIGGLILAGGFKFAEKFHLEKIANFILSVGALIFLCG